MRSKYSLGESTLGSESICCSRERDTLLEDRRLGERGGHLVILKVENVQVMSGFRLDSGCERLR